MPSAVVGAGAQRCGLCRLPGHRSPRCPIGLEVNIKHACKKPSCGPCSATCAVCDEVGHQPDNVDVKIIRGRSPRWSCPSFNMSEMQTRLQPKLRDLPPTERSKKEAAKGHKRTLSEIVPEDGERFGAHVARSNFVDLTGLGGAAASPAVRMAGGVAAALEDEGAPRAAARSMGAFVSDFTTQPAGGRCQPIPGPVGSAVEAGRARETVIDALKKALSEAPKYSAGTRSGARRRNQEAGLSGGRSSGSEEVLGSANPFFNSKGRDLKRALQRYVALSDGPELSLVKAAMTTFVGPGMAYTGASVTCGELTCPQVHAALMECAESVGLTLPAVCASMRQFIVELRHGDDDLQRFFDDPTVTSPAQRSTASE